MSLRRNLVILLLLILASLVQDSSCRGRGGFGGSRGGYRGGSSGSRTRGTFGGSTYRGRGGSYGVSRTSNRGYGTHGSGWNPAPRTSLYSNNYGGYSGRRSSSYNGFGLGLGAGLLIGYGGGMLRRPIGHTDSGYGYDYIHEDRGYNTDRPLECAVAGNVEYMRSLDDLQEINMDEGEKTCSMEEDVCFGMIEVVTVRFVLSDNATSVGDESSREGFVVKIEKGCAKRNELEMEHGQKGSYSSDRKCWIGHLRENTTVDVSSPLVDKELIESMGLNPGDVGSAGVSNQYELCVCEGWYCNGAGSFGMMRKGATVWEKGALLIVAAVFAVKQVLLAVTTLCDVQIPILEN